MENTLKIGKYSLIGLVWLVALLAIFELVSLTFLLQFSLFLFGVIIVVTTGFAIFNFAENPKAGMKFLIGVVAISIILGIGFGVGETSMDAKGDEIAGSRLTEAGIYTLNTLAIVALLLIALSEVKRILKK